VLDRQVQRRLPILVLADQKLCDSAEPGLVRNATCVPVRVAVDLVCFPRHVRPQDLLMQSLENIKLLVKQMESRLAVHVRGLGQLKIHFAQLFALDVSLCD